MSISGDIPGRACRPRRRTRPGPFLAALTLLGLVTGAASPVAAEGPSQAASRPQYGRPGPYVGAGGMAQIFVGRYDSESYGFGEVLVGYRASRYFGVDLDIQAGSRSISKVVAQGKVYPVGNWPIQPYLLLGLGTFIFPGRPNAVGLLRPGVGVDLFVSEHWVLAPTLYYEVIFASGGIDGIDAVNFGATLQYRF